MTQGFDELREITSAMNRSFKQGSASRQAEIEELQKRIDSIQEIMSAGVYHIPTLIKDLNNALKGESDE